MRGMMAAALALALGGAGMDEVAVGQEKKADPKPPFTTVVKFEHVDPKTGKAEFTKADAWAYKTKGGKWVISREGIPVTPKKGDLLTLPDGVVLLIDGTTSSGEKEFLDTRKAP